MRVRTAEQLKLAVNAPPRPEKNDAGGDTQRFRELQRGWVAAWGGRLLEESASDKEWSEWWKQSKTQHKKLMQAALDSENDSQLVDASDAPPAKRPAVRVAGLDYVTTAWLKQHAPEILSLSVSEPEEVDGGKRRLLRATVEFYDFDEEACRFDICSELEREEVECEEMLLTYDNGEVSTKRAREENALLRLVKPLRAETDKARLPALPSLPAATPHPCRLQPAADQRPPRYFRRPRGRLMWQQYKHRLQGVAYPSSCSATARTRARR